MLEELDNRVSLVAESVARAFSRRRFLGKSIKGAVAVVAGIALAEFVNVKEAWAACCHPSNGVYCSGCPAIPNLGGCPSGYSLCKFNNCGPTCSYNTGSWSCPCGDCNFGVWTCTDCFTGTCPSACTCSSGCFCPHCCSRKQVIDEARRLGISLPASVGSP
jgi:hypothetical protein